MADGRQMRYRLTEFAEHVFQTLNRLQIPYMLTGSVASFHYSEYRFTNDIDVVIDPSEWALEQFIEEMQELAMAEKEPAVDALRRRFMFNLMCYETAEKFDLILLKNGEYDKQAFMRRRSEMLSGVNVWIISPEDLIIAKLRWAKESLSEPQLRDVAGLMTIQKAAIDWPYTTYWVEHLNLLEAYEMARKEAEHRQV